MLTQTKFVKVLDKGLVTLPKAWCVALNLNKGTILQAKKVNRSIVIEPVVTSPAKAKVPYRIYSAAELNQFLKADQLK